MQPDRFTIKTEDAVVAAAVLAAGRRHAQILPEHLLSALLDQADGTVVPVLRKLGAGLDALRGSVIYRKLSLGTQSEHGEQRIERLLSVHTTCRLQRRPQHDYLLDALPSAPTAAATLC